MHIEPLQDISFIGQWNLREQGGGLIRTKHGLFVARNVQLKAAKWTNVVVYEKICDIYLTN